MKRNHKTRFFFLLILILLAFPPYSGEAEENKDAGYAPPPMFGTMNTPVVSRPVENQPAVNLNLDSPEAILSYPVTHQPARTKAEAAAETEAQSKRKRFIARRPVYETYRKPNPPRPEKKPVYLAKQIDDKKTQEAGTTISATTQALLDYPAVPPRKPYHKAIAEKAKAVSSSSASHYTSDDGPLMPAVPPKPVEKDFLPDAIETVGEVKGKDIALNNEVEDSPAYLQNKFSLDFEAGQAELGSSMLSALKGGVLKALQGKQASRVRVLAYARPEGTSFNNARRLSLARALAVREFFLQNGIEAKRIDVRGMGMKNQESPVDRVDLILID